MILRQMWKDVNSKRGFTLMELVVYMGIVGIIVIVAGHAFSNSTKFRVRTQNMLRATQEAENVATLFKADVSQMGAKSSMVGTVTGGEDDIPRYTDCPVGSTDCIYMDPNAADEEDKDYSSYRIAPVSGHTTTYDTLYIRRVRYDSLGHYQAIEHVTWFVDAASKVLKRRCALYRKVDSFDSGDLCTYDVEMASGIDTFKVYPAIPTIRSTHSSVAYQEEQVFPPPTGDGSFKMLARADGAKKIFAPAITAGGTDVTISTFASNYDAAIDKQMIKLDDKNKNEVYVALNSDFGATPSWNGNCQKFKLEPDSIEYEISFTMSTGAADNKMLLFVPGRDHMSVGFRKTSDGTKPTKIDDFMFYPPTNSDSETKRTMRFTVPETIEDVCMAFTFAMYSPVTSDGTVTISDLKFKRVASSNYFFDKAKTIATVDKKNVKALKLKLQIGRGGKKDPAKNKVEPGETGVVEMIVPTPSNGFGL